MAQHYEFNLPSCPLRLTNLAVNKVVDTMQQSVHRLDTFISTEISKLGLSGSFSMITSNMGIPPAQCREKSVSWREADGPSTPGTVHTIENSVLHKAARQMMEVRKYLYENLQGSMFSFVLTHAIARAIDEKNVRLLRLAIRSDVPVLDFRALEHRTEVQNNVPSNLSSMLNLELPRPEPTLSDLSISKSSTVRTNLSVHVACEIFLPPNEFDWFSRDKIGKILSLAEVCELFSIMKMSNCAEQLRELYINGKRLASDNKSVYALSTVSEMLMNLTRLTKLVLRGFCDDATLKTIGHNCSQLRHLDVSGSRLVTDGGIQDLFFKERSQNAVVYLMSAWLAKNVDKMNPLSSSLTHLDYSWTSVSSVTRTMIQLLPGSYLFKRLFSRTEQDAFGHHIFIREQASFQDLIPSKFDDSQCKAFEKQLANFVGSNGVKTFLKIIEFHPWKNCILNLYSLANLDEEDNNVSLPDRNCYAIITPNEMEKRIQGVIHWCNGNLTQLYTIYPVNINTLGNIGKLRIFRGVVNDTWRMQSSLLPYLVELNIFTEPLTLVNIIQSCPQLRKLTVRVRRFTLTDSHILNPIRNSMCRRTLEDVWIAPGVNVESSSSTLNENYSVGKTDFRPQSSTGSKSERNLGNEMGPNIKTNRSASGHEINELVQLSLEFIDTLIVACPNIKRLGDVSLWSQVEPERLYLYCEDLKRHKKDVAILWANMKLPNHSKRGKTI